MLSFNDFQLQPTTRAVLANMEITSPTPVQAEAIPALLAGNDVVGQSPTGSGKTLAYGIPLVERLSKERVVQALVLVPTRELAVQVNAVLSKLATSRRLSTAVLVGGRAYGPQLSALRYGAQIVVGTPGRVKDHLDQGTLVLSHLRMCVLDEADEMLDIGFAPAIEEILTTTPSTRQMALFSATIPTWIVKLQEKFLKNPVKIDITVAMSGESTIEQIAYQVPHDQKIAALCTLLHSGAGESSLVFGKTKFGVEKLGKQLSKLGFTVGTLHGNKSQRAREEVLTAFRRGQVQTLLATNVAARGLDITGIYQVINYELPESSNLFTHRIGRTGRMGRQGKAITLLVPSDVPKWRRMARTLGQAVALQRLTIDEEAMITPPMPKQEAPVTQQLERKQDDDQQPSVRGPKRVPQGQERSRRERPERDNYAVSDRAHSHPQAPQGRRTRPERDTHATYGMKRRPQERVISERPARTSEWQPERFPVAERPYSSKKREGRREAGEQSNFGRAPRKRKASSFVEAAPQYAPAKRRRGAMKAIQGERATGARRFAGR